jgi:hypothetical protein
MSDDRRPVDVAILAFAETSASVVYGFYDSSIAPAATGA